MTAPVGHCHWCVMEIMSCVIPPWIFLFILMTQPPEPSLFCRKETNIPRLWRTKPFRLLTPSFQVTVWSISVADSGVWVDLLTHTGPPLLDHTCNIPLKMSPSTFVSFVNKIMVFSKNFQWYLSKGWLRELAKIQVLCRFEFTPVIFYFQPVIRVNNNCSSANEFHPFELMWLIIRL